MNVRTKGFAAALAVLMLASSALCLIPGTDLSGAGSPSYSGATVFGSSSSEEGGIYSSDTSDQNAILITGGTVKLTDVTVTKTGGSGSGDGANFYGINSAVMAKGGAQAYIDGGTISTSASGANGVFSYGGNSDDGTTVTISNVTITTTGSNSGGIMTTGGGTTIANDLIIVTEGGSSAPIRSDRGGGTVIVNGGTYTSHGSGSPAIYSTADITVNDAVLLTTTSQGICIEGDNSVTLNDCSLTTNNTKNHNSYFANAVLIYQSGSGDARSGTSHFTAQGGTITCNNGHVIHVTHTDTVIFLSGVKIVNNDPDNVLLSVCDNHWGNGKNSADLTASAQVLNGNILVGSNSSLTMSLENGSVFTGCISGDIVSDKGDTISSSVGTVSVSLDSTSRWVLTADTVISSFEGDPSNVVTNGYSLYVGSKLLEGTTEYDDSISYDDQSGTEESSSDTSSSEDVAESSDVKDDTGGDSGWIAPIAIVAAVIVAGLALIVAKRHRLRSFKPIPGGDHPPTSFCSWSFRAARYGITKITASRYYTFNTIIRSSRKGDI